MAIICRATSVNLYVRRGRRFSVGFTKFSWASKIDGPARNAEFGDASRTGNSKARKEGGLMVVATGELIRAMNYVEDITTTLRRICIYIPNMSPEERKRLAESLRGAAAAVNAAVADLEKVEK